MAVYHKIKELAPKLLQKLRAENAKHDPRISQLTPHSGRASFITHLMAQGYNLRMSMKQARHAPGSVKVHLRYGQLALTDIKAAVDKTDTAKAGLNEEATRDMTAQGYGGHFAWPRPSCRGGALANLWVNVHCADRLVS